MKKSLLTTFFFGFAGALALLVGYRNGTGERMDGDTIPAINISDTVHAIEINDTTTWWYAREPIIIWKGNNLFVTNMDTIGKPTNAVILSGGSATRDPKGNWKVYDSKKALESLYQLYNRCMDKPLPVKPESELKIQLHSYPYPSPLPDSTEPKYRLVMKPAVKASLDSIDMYLLPVIGQSLTVDQANQAKSFLMSQIFRIIQYARPDSVKIENNKR
jgi:hypothetical protein